MKSWSVFEPPDAPPASLEAADKAVFVKDGFSFAAFAFTPVWLLWRRMWLVFLFWLGAQVVLAGLAAALHLDKVPASILSFLFDLVFALDAGALRAWSLRRKGWRLMGVVRAQDLVEAEIRYFHGRDVGVGGQALPPSSTLPSAASPQASAAMGPWGAYHGTSGVIGVFPEPQGRGT